jgi:hypothetical protein
MKVYEVLISYAFIIYFLTVVVNFQFFFIFRRTAMWFIFVLVFAISGTICFILFIVVIFVTIFFADKLYLFFYFDLIWFIDITCYCAPDLTIYLINNIAISSILSFVAFYIKKILKLMVVTHQVIALDLWAHNYLVENFNYFR